MKMRTPPMRYLRTAHHAELYKPHLASLAALLVLAFIAAGCVSSGDQKATPAELRENALQQDDSLTTAALRSRGPESMLMREKAEAEAESTAPTGPTYLARKVAVDPNDTLIPLTDAVREELNPDSQFSLGLDRLIRDGFEPLNHRNILVVTNRLALDSEGRHLLESLLLSRKPIVRRVVLFNDELPAPARTPDMDRVLAAYPEIRVFERNSRNFELTDTMFGNAEIVLIDLPYRGGHFHPEAGFLSEVLVEAALKKLRVIVLDRPLPVSGSVFGGPAGDARFYGTINSYHPTLPVMGLTTGEMSHLINNHFGLGLEIEVIQMADWTRDQGYTPLLETYRRLGIDPSRNIPEWASYIPANTATGQWTVISGMLPPEKVTAVNAESLSIDPSPLTPEEFIQNLTTFSVAGLTAQPIEGDSPTVRLTADRSLSEPVFLTVALWSIWASADPSLLPAPGQPGMYGTTFVFDGLREGRHPRELQRLWRLNPGYQAMENRRTRSLLY